MANTLMDTFKKYEMTVVKSPIKEEYTVKLSNKLERTATRTDITGKCMFL